MSGNIQTGRVPPELIPEAIARIVARTSESPQTAARRFLANAAAHGIDPSLCWATISDRPPRVRQVCLVVPGSGKTANLFLAPPLDGCSAETQAGERIDVLASVEEGLHDLVGSPVRVLQSLPEPGEPWAAEAFRSGKFTHCGTLSYLRLSLTRAHARTEPGLSPDGVVVRSVETMGAPSAWRGRMEAALEASYVGSLDCPELWGVRETSDVLDSHLATGEWDPALWWLVEREGQPMGAALFNALGDGTGCELVYVGLAPELRGMGLGAHLLAMGVNACAGRGLREMTCAVDRRNTPALRLYENRGFHEFAERDAFVRRLVER